MQIIRLSYFEVCHRLVLGVRHKQDHKTLVNSCLILPDLCWDMVKVQRGKDKRLKKQPKENWEEKGPEFECRTRILCSRSTRTGKLEVEPI